MQVNATAAEHPGEPLYLRVAWLCGIVLSLEGYDIAEVGYAIPSLVDAWHVGPSAFTRVLTAGNVGLLLGSLIAGLLGDRLGRRPVLIGCVTGFGLFSLLSALAGSPSQLAGLRFVTGLALGGGIPLAIALASDVAPPEAQRRLVVLMSVGVPVGFTVGGLLASQLVRLFGWPAIFVAGGALPLAMIPVLAQRLPETMSQRPTARWRGQVAALFHNGLASSTVLLWVISLLNLLCNYLILLWTPVLLHGLGISPSWSIFATTMYGLVSSLVACCRRPSWSA